MYAAILLKDYVKFPSADTLCFVQGAPKK